MSNMEVNERVCKMQRMLALSSYRSGPCNDHFIHIYESTIMALYLDRLDDYARTQRAPLRL